MADVMHIVWQMNTGGIEMFVKDMCKKQLQLGIEPVIVETGPEVGEMVENLKITVCPVLRCPLHPRLSYIFRLTKLLKEVKPRAIHHHAFGTAVLSAIAARLAGVQCVVETAHSLHAYSTKGWRRVRRLVINYLFLCLITHRIAVSNDVRRSMQANKNVHVIHNGVDFNRFQVSRSRRILSECGLTFKKGVVVIGNIGSFRLVKNHDMLIRVASRVIEEAKKPVVFICAGVGKRFDEIKKKILSIGHKESIILVGLYKNIPEFLSCCDIFFMPSKFEGFPIACIEAMAAGIPPVVSDVVGLREVVLNDKVGRKFPLDDENIAVETILNLLSDIDLRKKIGLQAKQFVKQFFSLETCVTKYNKLYGFEKAT